MSFSEFKNIPEVQKKYAIKYSETNFIKAKILSVSSEFQQAFDFNLDHFDAFASEAARCEIIIFPVLREAYKPYAELFALWVQKSISVDKELNGTPDYMLSKKSAYGKLYLENPLLAVVEAKKNDFEQGWGQCLAELVAAQKINEDESLPVYGIVTDGKNWEYGYLKGHHFYKNTKSYSIDNLSELFGSLDFIFQQIVESIVDFKE
ncbi:MAG: hypothetical protein GQ569_03805 [Methylococcaceae bacterium]|nr:hypothetical protein [Methylococcaceae bacterium]